jgi:hypothetical protein
MTQTHTTPLKEGGIMTRVYKLVFCYGDRWGETSQSLSFLFSTEKLARQYWEENKESLLSQLDTWHDYSDAYIVIVVLDNPADPYPDEEITLHEWQSEEYAAYVEGIKRRIRKQRKKR